MNTNKKADIIKVGDWIYAKNRPEFFFQVKELYNFPKTRFKGDESLPMGEYISVLSTGNEAGFRITKEKAIKLKSIRKVSLDLNRFIGKRLICLNNRMVSHGVNAGDIVYFTGIYSISDNIIRFAKAVVSPGYTEMVGKSCHFAVHPVDLNQEVLPYIELKIVDSWHNPNKRSIRLCEGDEFSFRTVLTRTFKKNDIVYMISKSDFEKLRELKGW